MGAFRRAEDPLPPGSPQPGAYRVTVTPGYFDTLKLRLVEEPIPAMVKNTTAVPPAALATTSALGLPEDDNLCCGAAGCAETLLLGAQLLRRQDLHAQAQAMLAALLHRARSAGAWQLRPRVPCGAAPPGLFTGRAGIGYQLLRAADPSLPSVLLPLRLPAS